MSPKQPPPSWSSIPNKFQLALICSIRIVDFFQQAALQAYVFYQLASFAPDAPESTISFQTGVLQGVFTAAQVFTSPLWGRAADSPLLGRKGVILISLIGQGVSCFGVAFCRSFGAAAVWRCLGGAVNASVGGARTSLSESTPKKYHSRTFLLLSLAWNIANIFGPLVGGLLSDPVRYHPALFGERSIFGGEHGSSWLKAFPYAPPNLFCGVLLFANSLLLWMYLNETLITLQSSRDRGFEFRERLNSVLRTHVFKKSGYSRLYQDDLTPAPLLTAMEGDDENDSTLGTPMAQRQQTNPLSPHMRRLSQIRLPNDAAEGLAASAVAPELPAASATTPVSSTRSIMTKNVLLVLTNMAILDFQLGGFTALWSIFLSSRPRQPEDPSPKLPFDFTGGLGFSPSTVGLAMSVLGAVGILCQFTLYPRVATRFGVLRATTFSLILFPVAYILAPYLSLLAPYSQSLMNILLWSAILAVALLVISARTFTIPGSVLLINNASPGPETLGTIHGLGAATSSAFRTLGPIIAGRWYQVGLTRNRVGEAWWLLAFWAGVGCVPVWFVKDGG